MSVSNKTYALCMTLTYGSTDDFETKNISSFIDKLRRVHKRQLVYVLALERESCLHYHLIVWLPIGVSLSLDRLSKWRSLGSTWIKRCRDVSRWGSYIAKFTKPKKLFLRGARLYGYGGLDEAAKTAIARKSMPVWLRKLPLLESGLAVGKVVAGRTWIQGRYIFRLRLGVHEGYFLSLLRVRLFAYSKVRSLVLNC